MHQNQLEIRGYSIHSVPQGIERPKGKMEHAGIMLLCATIIGMSFLLSVEEDNVVRIPWLGDRSLPELCLLKEFLGVECPTCGLTRSLISFSHLEFRRALRFNHAGILIYVFALLQIPYRLHAIMERGGLTKNAGIRSLTRLYVHLIVLILIVSWLYKLLNIIWSY